MQIYLEDSLFFLFPLPCLSAPFLFFLHFYLLPAFRVFLFLLHLFFTFPLPFIFFLPFPLPSILSFPSCFFFSFPLPLINSSFSSLSLLHQFLLTLPPPKCLYWTQQKCTGWVLGQLPKPNRKNLRACEVLNWATSKSECDNYWAPFLEREIVNIQLLISLISLSLTGCSCFLEIEMSLSWQFAFMRDSNVLEDAT